MLYFAIYKHFLFALLASLGIYSPEDDIVEVETRRMEISDNLLIINYCAICWISYCIICLLHGTWIALRYDLCC